MSKQNKTLLTSRPPLIRRRLSKDPYQKLLPLAARLRSCYVLLYLIFLTTLLHSQAAAQNNSSDWIYLENLNLKLGILKSHGGAIAYLSSAGSNENLLNHYDHGRLVQQSYYGDSDGSKWVDKPWRYNPVQGGDYQGKAAELVEYNTTSTSVYCRTTPRHWANGDLLSECSMEQWTELNEKHVKIHFKFTYQGQHTHKATHQETPAVFVSPRLKTLSWYQGEHPWTSADLSSRKPGWPNESLQLQENWAAYVDENNFGVGVYVPKSHEATSYFFAGGNNSDCSYIAPLQTFDLKPGLVFEYDAYLAVGELSEVRSTFYSIHQHRESKKE